MATGRPRFIATLTALAAALFLILGVVPAQAATSEYQGVQLHSLWYDNSSQDVETQLDLAQGSGAKLIRVDLSWSSAEQQGKGNWSSTYLGRVDSLVQKAAQRNLKVLFTLFTTPCWASTAPESAKQGCSGSWWDRDVQNYPPADPGDYANALAYLADRYRGKVAAWEIWNEPNLTGGAFWRTQDPAGDYAALVKAAYPKAKQADPAAAVLAGALSFADRPFLDQLYAQGIKGSYDGISFHPYNEWRDPNDRWKPEWKKYTFVPGTEWMHEGQLAAGDNTPLWITEYGWTTASDGKWKVTEAQQADYIKKAVAITRSWSYVKAAVAYNLRNKGTNAAEPEHNFGLVRQDYTKKPAYAAFQDALQHPSTATPPKQTKKPRVRLVVKGYTSKRGKSFRFARGRKVKVRAVTERGTAVKVMLKLKRGAKAKTLQLRQASGAATTLSFKHALRLRRGVWRLQAVRPGATPSKTISIKTS